ncbi:MAG: molybdopterin-dependent oxidoreductase, partial [bacterium]|nr:molybdopterin-dependent oxidoreductase [bacterium]
MGVKYFGASVARKEDPRLLRGKGRFVDDIKLPGLLHAVMVRSPHPHARIKAIQVETARTHPGVAGVFVYQDVADNMKPMPSFGAAPPGLLKRLDLTLRTTPQYPLALDTVRYVGEPVAVVVARNRAEAEDAAELVEVDYEPLPTVVDTEAAARADAPRLFADWDSNIALHFKHSVGDADAAIEAADVVVKERFRIQRYSGIPIECRGLVVEPHAVDAQLTMWVATQFPHALQEALVQALGWPAHRIRVVAPEVGGGFGVKASMYAEEVVLPI